MINWSKNMKGLAKMDLSIFCDCNCDGDGKVKHEHGC